MEQRLDVAGANEMQLFHGCSDEVCQKIDHARFNRSFSCVEAQHWGILCEGRTLL
jgi:hypothetical protein